MLACLCEVNSSKTDDAVYTSVLSAMKPAHKSAIAG